MQVKIQNKPIAIELMHVLRSELSLGILVFAFDIYLQLK